MTRAQTPVWISRFLAPHYGLSASAVDDWQASGAADTPGEDARCRIWLGYAADAQLIARFAVFGPPVAIAAADWICEQVDGHRLEAVYNLTATNVERALALAPAQRYAGLLATDALANALVNMGS